VMWANNRHIGHSFLKYSTMFGHERLCCTFYVSRIEYKQIATFVLSVTKQENLSNAKVSAW